MIRNSNKDYLDMYINEEEYFQSVINKQKEKYNMQINIIVHVHHSTISLSSLQLNIQIERESYYMII